MGRRSAAAPSWLVAPARRSRTCDSPAPLQGAAEPQTDLPGAGSAHDAVGLVAPLSGGGGVELGSVEAGSLGVGCGPGDEGGALGVGSEAVGVGSGADEVGGVPGLLGPGAVGLGAVP